MTEALNKKVISGTKWTAIDNIATRLLQLVVVSIMARLLTPEDFGIVSIALFFVAFGAVIETSGFTFAYIRDRDHGPDSYSTLLAMTLGAAVLIVFILLLGSGFVADFYNRQSLEWVMIALSFGVIVDGFSSAMRAHNEKSLIFSTSAKAKLIGLFAGATIAVASALLGAGLWALVLQNLVQKSVFLFLLLITGRYPRLQRPNFRRSRAYLAYGWPLQLAGVLNIFSREANIIFVGGAIGVSSAGIYSRANTLQAILVQTTVATVEKVAFPVLAQVQDRREDLILWIRTSNKIYSYILYPCLAAMLVAADDLVSVLFGPNWADAGFYMRFLIAIGCVRFLQSANHTLLKVQGETKSNLVFRVYEAGITLVMLLLAIPFGMIGLVLGQVASAYVSYVLVAIRTQRRTGYTFIAQLKDVGFNACLALGSGLLAYLVQLKFGHNLPIVNILQIGFVCIGLYFAVGLLLRRPEAKFVSGLVQQLLCKGYKFRR